MKLTHGESKSIRNLILVRGADLKITALTLGTKAQFFYQTKPPKNILGQIHLNAFTMVHWYGGCTNTNHTRVFVP